MSIKLYDKVTLYGKKRDVGQKFGMKFIHAQFCGHGGRRDLCITGKHDGLPDAAAFQVRDGCCRILLWKVGDDDVSGIETVHGNMNDGAGLLAGMPCRAGLLHESAVSGADRFSIHFCPHAVTCDFFHIRYSVRGSLFAPCTAQGL